MSVICHLANAGAVYEALKITKASTHAVDW